MAVREHGCLSFGSQGLAPCECAKSVQVPGIEHELAGIIGDIAKAYAPAASAALERVDRAGY